MKHILNKIRMGFSKIKLKITDLSHEDDLDLYEFEQLDRKRSYRPIRNPWEQI